MAHRSLRVALYSHDTVGLGHVRRNLLIADTLRRHDPAIRTLMLTGAHHTGVLPRDVSHDCVALPALTKRGRRVRSRSGTPLPSLLDVRAQTIRAALRSFAPDLLIVDKVPRGVGGELELALGDIRARGGRCVLGLRDILDDPIVVQREWREAGNETAIRDYYDAVWVYGDRQVVDVARDYRLADATAAKIRYTGYLDRRVRDGEALDDARACFEQHAPKGKFVLCTLGGGEDGLRLAESFCRIRLPRDTGGVMLTGPFMPADARARLRGLLANRPEIRMIDFVREPGELMRRADRVICMGGYNTFCEILAYEKRALVVPRVLPRTEQWIRAQRFEELGQLAVCHPGDLSPRALESWLEQDVPRASRDRIDLHGLARIPELAAELARDVDSAATHAA